MCRDDLTACHLLLGFSESSRAARSSGKNLCLPVCYQGYSRGSWWAAKGKACLVQGMWGVYQTAMLFEIHCPLRPGGPLPGSSPNPVLWISNTFHRRNRLSHWLLGTSSTQHLRSPQMMGWGQKWNYVICALGVPVKLIACRRFQGFRIIVRKGTWRPHVVPAPNAQSMPFLQNNLLHSSM